MTREEAIDVLKRNYPSGCFEELCNAVDIAIKALSAQPSYTDEEVQKMQELEQAEIQKAFQLGREDALSEIIRCKECKHGMYDVMCKFYWCHGVAHSANWFCADGERREDE